MAYAPDKIRNVAVVGHRGTGKTSLTEALLFQAGEITRLGSVADGTTVSDHDDDERRRGLSISAALIHAEWNGRKLNLIDTPGDPSFQAEALGSLRVVEGALFVISGVLGTEVSTVRLWKRCEELGIARVAFVNMLDRERADFAAALESLQSQLSKNLVAISLPIGEEHGFTGVVDLLHMVAYEDAADGSREGDPVAIPDALQAQAEEWRERLMDHVAEASDDLMERYLEGEPISDEELVDAFKDLVVRGELFPVACGAASRNVGTRAPARPDRRRPSVAGARRADPRPRSLGRRRRPRARGITASPRTASRRSRTRTSASSACCAYSRGASAPRRRSSTSARTTRSASGRSSRSRAASTGRCPIWVRATSEPCRS